MLKQFTIALVLFLGTSSQASAAAMSWFCDTYSVMSRPNCLAAIIQMLEDEEMGETVINGTSLSTQNTWIEQEQTTQHTLTVVNELIEGAIDGTGG